MADENGENQVSSLSSMVLEMNLDGAAESSMRQSIENANQALSRSGSGNAPGGISTGAANAAASGPLDFMSDAAARARADFAKGIGANIPTTPWPDKSKPPSLPKFPPRNAQNQIRVGEFKQTPRVRTGDTDPRNRWNPHPEEDEAAEDRAIGDSVFLRVQLNGKNPAAPHYVDRGGRFVPLERVEMIPEIRDDPQIARTIFGEAIRLMYYEEEQRIAAYERDVEIYLGRVLMYLAWAPPTNTDVWGVDSREQCEQKCLAELQKAHDQYTAWDTKILSRDFKRDPNTRRRQLALNRDILIHQQITDADTLNSRIEDMPTLPVPGSSIWSSDITGPVQGQINSLKDEFKNNEDGLKAFIDNCMTTNTFKKRVLSGETVMMLSAARGWSKMDLIEMRPNLATRCKKFVW